MTHSKIVTYEDLEKEVLARAAEFARARTALYDKAGLVAHANPLDIKEWAPEVAAPTALYAVAKDTLAAISALYEFARGLAYENLLQSEMYLARRALYDAAYPPLE